jgi:hypothetical protein
LLPVAELAWIKGKNDATSKKALDPRHFAGLSPTKLLANGTKAFVLSRMGLGCFSGGH